MIWIEENDLSKTIFNIQELGSYDFTTQLIEIDNDMFSRTTEQVQNIINTDNLIELNDKDLELYKTYVHEVTHFLDSTTTIWGTQYSARLNRYYNHQDKQTLEVLAINDAEITANENNLTEHDSVAKFSIIKYKLEYCKELGVVVEIHFFDDYENPLYSSSLSMLALLEGHAYVKEHLVALKKHKLENDLVELNLLKKEIKRKALEIKSCEYTVYLALSMQLLPNIDIEVHLDIVCKVFEICLDLPSIYLASTPYFLFDMVFVNCYSEKLISQLKLEFARGQNRHVLALLLLCLVLNKINNKIIFVDANFANNLEKYILEDYASQNQEFDELLELIIGMWEIEMAASINILKEVNAELPLSMLNQRIKIGWGVQDFENYNLPDITTNYIDKVSFKKSLDFDIEQHYNQVKEKSNLLKKDITYYGIRREHATPNFSHGFLDWMMKNPGGGVYTHFDD